MKTTENLGLRKPEENDFYNIEDFNNNADALDALFEKNEDGSVAAKNAKTLDGHEAEYFAPLSRFNGEMLSTSVKEKALSLDNGVHFFFINGTNYTGADLPETTGWKYISVIIAKRNTNSIEIVLFDEIYPTIAIASYNGTKWSDWKVMFTTDGGTIKGDVNVANTEEAVRLTIRLQNKLRQIISRVYDDGSYQLFDMTNNSKIIESKVGGTNTFNGTASGNLPLTGDSSMATRTIGRSSNNPLILKNTNSGNNQSVLGFQTADHGTLGRLGFYGVDNLVFVKGDSSAYYNLLHTGNKPTGTYTGNGSATSRQIATNGFSNAICIFGGGAWAIITPQGGIGASANGGALTVYSKAEANFSGGVLTLATASSIINDNGITHSYHVL